MRYTVFTRSRKAANMQTLWNPDTLKPFAALAARNLEAKHRKLLEEIQKGLGSRPVRCGFLWLKTRTPSASELEERRRASRDIFSDVYDPTWFQISILKDYADAMQKITLQCSSGCATIELSDEESQIITLYGEFYNALET